MSKTYRPYEPDQQLLLPAALQEWLPSDHLAHFVSDVVDQLDLSPIMARYQSEERGGPPYHPRMMVKVLVYAYCIGVASSRRIALRLHEDIAFRVLAANNTPDFRTISDFRKDHLGALAGLFLQVLELCRKAGLVKLGHVALDGTKMKANASKHQAMSYGRMKEKEAQLAREVDELLKRAQEVDEEEDRRYGRDRRGDELPEELSFRESRLRKIREAKAALEAEAAAAEQAEGKGRDPSGVPADKTQRNFTDPESRIMPSGVIAVDHPELRKIRDGHPAAPLLEAGSRPARRNRPKVRRRDGCLSGVPAGAGKTHLRNASPIPSPASCAPGGRDFIQGYNCQAVVDSAHQVIVAARATNRPTDKAQAVGMIQETVLNTGAVPREVSADAGYYSAQTVDDLYALGVDPFVAPGRTRYGTAIPPAPRGRIPGHLSAGDRMRRKLRTKRGRQRYALRMKTVEPVFGQAKQGRGFRQFLLRGLEKVNREWLMICTGHNVLKLFRFGRPAPA